MSDVRGVLLDDLTFVEVGGRVVGGCADQLDAAIEGLAIRVRTDERRKERMVDVDDPIRVRCDEVVAEDLHVASHHDQLDAMIGERCQHLSLLFGLGVRRHGKVKVGHAHVFGDAGVVWVVRHDDP